MRIVLGVNRYINIQKMLEALGWMSVSQLIVYECCILIHKSFFGLSPSNLIDKLDLVGDNHDYNTRQRGLLKIRHTRTHSAEKSLVYRGFSWYNSLPDSIKNGKRLKIFEFNLKNYVKNNYYL